MAQPRSLLLDLDPALFFVAVTFLDLTTVESMVAVSKEMRVLALDEEVWRYRTLLAFGTKMAPGFAPPDSLWRAEYHARRQAHRREDKYILQFQQGRAGRVEPPAPRLVGPRYCALEGEHGRARAVASRAALSALLASVPSAGGAAGVAAELQSNIANASKEECVSVRQGSCSWSILKAPV